MGRIIKYSKALKLEAIKKYMDGESSVTLAQQHDVCSTEIIHKWVEQYKVDRKNLFDYSKKNQYYGKDLKESAIKDCLDGEGSLETIANKYHISEKSILSA